MFKGIARGELVTIDRSVDRFWSEANAGPRSFIFFFFNDTATTEIYTLSLHDALPIFPFANDAEISFVVTTAASGNAFPRSEEHTSELQSRLHLVCRLLLEKKKNQTDKVSVYDVTVERHRVGRRRLLAHSPVIPATPPT